MKKQMTLALLALLTFGSTNAQSKIKDGTVTSGAAPNANAILDLESNNKGLLLPRVALDSTGLATPLSAKVAGMTVYNTATSKDVTPGYYYNDGTKWISVKEPWNVVDGTLNKVPATLNTQDIYQSGRVFIGYPTDFALPTATTLLGHKVNVHQNMSVSRIGVSSNFVLVRANGSWAAPSAVGWNAGGTAYAADILGNFLFEGWNGTARLGVAQISAVAATSFVPRDDAARPGFPSGQGSAYIDFQTRDYTETGLYTKMRLTPNGTLAIGTTIPNTSTQLHVVKKVSQLTPAIIEGCNEYADNAAAVTAGLPVGGLYRTGEFLKVVHP